MFLHHDKSGEYIFQICHGVYNSMKYNVRDVNLRQQIKIYYGEKEKVKNLNLCEQKKGYEYALYRILELYHYKRNLFDVVVDNYMKKITV